MTGCSSSSYTLKSLCTRVGCRDSKDDFLDLFQGIYFYRLWSISPQDACQGETNFFFPGEIRGVALPCVPENIICCSVTKLCLTLCSPMGCSTPGFPVLHYLPEFAQTHDHWVSDAIQLSHLLSPTSSPALNLSQHQGLFQWVSSLHQVVKVLELQHQSF